MDLIVVLVQCEEADWCVCVFPFRRSLPSKTVVCRKTGSGFCSDVHTTVLTFSVLFRSGVHTCGVGAAGEETQDGRIGAERPGHHHGYRTEGTAVPSTVLSPSACTIT